MPAVEMTFRIRADKTGPKPPEGQPWPCRGVEIVGEPPTEVRLPASFVLPHASDAWLTLVNPRAVQRPTQPNPIDEDGSAAVAPEHWAKTGVDAPRQFVHLDEIIFDTLSHGRLRYRVTVQPDKYLDTDDPNDKVTVADYAAGRTRVDNFYTCVLEG